MSLEIFVYLCPNWYILTRRSCTYFVSSSRPWLQQSNKTNKIRNSWSWFGVNFTDDRYTINTSDHEFECDWLIPSTVTWLVTKRALIELGYCKFVHFSSLEFCWLLDHSKRKRSAMIYLRFHCTEIKLNSCFPPSHFETKTKKTNEHNIHGPAESWSLASSAIDHQFHRFTWLYEGGCPRTAEKDRKADLMLVSEPCIVSSIADANHHAHIHSRQKHMCNTYSGCKVSVKGQVSATKYTTHWPGLGRLGIAGMTHATRKWNKQKEDKFQPTFKH